MAADLLRARPGRARRRTAVPFALSLVLASGPADAADPPPRASAAAVDERVREVTSLASDVAPALGLDEPARAARERCRALAGGPSRCPVAPLDSCRKALVDLDRAAAGTTASGDRLTAATLRHLRSEIADATIRLSGLRAEAAGGRCAATAPAGAIPAAAVLLYDGRTFRLRPLVALRGGRRWSLVIDGLPPALREGLEILVPDRTGDAMAAGTFRDSWRGADLLEDADARRGLEFVERLERGLPRPIRLPGQAGALLRTDAPLTAADFSEMRAYFVAGDAPGAIVTFPVPDPRTPFLEARARLRRDPCSPRPLERFAPDPADGAVATSALYLRGRYRSWDLRDGRPQEPAEHELLLVLPESHDAETPLVLLVDGITGNARRVLGYHAAELAARGLATLAIDLPDHGTRSITVGAEPFLDPLAPRVLERNLRQAVVDVMAAVHTATTCGFGLPGDAVYRPREVGYLGYSLGAMVGTIVRAVERDVGTTVLLAGGGHLFAWETLRVAQALGTPLVTCLGGADHGASCFGTGRCAAPGVCIKDPRVLELARQLELPHDLVFAGVDPIEFASLRTGPASHGPLLFITAGEDAALYPLLATRLADAYGMRVVGPHRRRGPRSTSTQWPALDHGLRSEAAVRRQAHDFLASRGRRGVDVAAPNP